MSAQYLNQPVPNRSVNIRVNDAVIDNSVVTHDLQINNYFYEKWKSGVILIPCSYYPAMLQIYCVWICNNNMHCPWCSGL